MAALTSQVAAQRALLTERDAEAARLNEQMSGLDVECRETEATRQRLQRRTKCAGRCGVPSASGDWASCATPVPADVTAGGRDRPAWGGAAASYQAREQAAAELLGQEAAKQAGQVESLEGERGTAEQRCSGSRQALDDEKSAAFEAVRRASLLQSEHAGLTRQRDRARADVRGARDAGRRTQRAAWRSDPAAGCGASGGG